MVASPIPSPVDSIARRIPSLPLPAYRYVPGLQPHPWRSELGHHHNDQLPEMAPLWTPDVSWGGHTYFLHACDLFDLRFFWEAHEVWEEVWHAVPREHSDRERLQFLIQAAACCLKTHTGSLGPARTLLERCRERVGRFEAVVICPEALIEGLERFISGGDWPRL